MERLELQEWQIRVEFSDFGEGQGFGSCKCLSAYRDVLLEFDPSRIPPHEDIEQLVVHELMHILTMPLHEMAVIGLSAPDEAKIDMAAERVVHDIATRIVKLMTGKVFPRLQFPQEGAPDGSGAGDYSPGGAQPCRRA